MKHLLCAARPFLTSFSCLALFALCACGEDTNNQLGPLDANTSVGADANFSADAGLLRDGAPIDGLSDGAQPSDASESADAMTDVALMDATTDVVVAPVTIDFEMVNGVTPGGITGAVAAGSRLSDQLQGDYGVSFRSVDKPYVALVRLGVGHATSGANGIGSVSASDTMAYSTMTITFSMPGNPSLPAVTNQVSIRGDQTAIAGTASIEAFDVDEVSLGKATFNDVAGGVTLLIAKPKIHSITLTQDSKTIAFDDLVFNPLMPAPSP